MIEILSQLIAFAILLLFLLFLVNVNKGKNKRVTLLMRAGLGMVILDVILLLGIRKVITLSPEEFDLLRSVSNLVLRDAGSLVFVMGLYLLSKEYKRQSNK